jgi:WD40 repeat protein
VSAPETSFYVTGGTLRHDAPSYVERQADRDVFEGLLAGEFCYVLTPRQMGKSSLMVRTASRLREQGVNVIALDLTAIGQNLTPEQWYDGLLARMGRQLTLDEELERFWRAHERLGPCQRLFAAIRDVVLRHRPGPLVIFVDEIDSVRSLPFSTDEFFAAMRECYNRRAEDPGLNRLTFCLLGVATPSDLIRDTRTTPFNIGRRIELHDFTRVEAAPLAQGLRDTVTSDDGRSNATAGGNAASAILTSGRLLTRILYWTGGHPYLTQRFCRAVVEDASMADAADVDRICEDLFLSSRARERDDNLLFVRERLLRSETDLTSLLEHYRKVRRGEPVPDDETSRLVSVLRLSGIVASEEGFLRERNRIYARVFDEEWIRAHLPEAELRRQRAAFYRGVVRTTAIAAVVVAALTMVILIAMREARKAQIALAQARFSEARTKRVGGVAGHRHESLRALGAARGYFTNEAILRDEVIACLALVDLLERTNGIRSPQHAKVLQIELDAGVSAEAGTNGSITIGRLDDGRLVSTLPGVGQAVEQVRFGSGGRLLVAVYRGGGDGSFTVWDWQKVEKLFGVAHGIQGAAVDLSSDGRMLAVGTDDGKVIMYSLPGGDVLHKLDLRLDTGAVRAPQALRFHPSGNLLAECCRYDQHVQVWDFARTQQVARLYHSGVVRDLAWHARGDLLATACEDSRIYLWNTNTMDNVDSAGKLSGHDGGVKEVAFNHRGTLLASLGSDETLRLWSPATGVRVIWRLDDKRLEGLRFSGSDDLLAAVAPQQTNARVWEVSGNEYVSLQAPGGLSTIDFSPDGRLLAAAAADHAMIWDSVSGRELGIVKFSHSHAHAVAFSADSQSLLASCDDGLFSTSLDVQGEGDQHRVSAGAMQRWTNVTNELRSMALDPNRRAAALVHQNEVLVVPLEPGNTAKSRKVSAAIHYRHLAIHPDGKWMAGMSGNSDSLDLWNLSNANGAYSQMAIPSSEYFAFSPDGKWFVICHTGKYVFYRVGRWQEPVFPIHRKPASSQYAPIAFSSRGGLVALAVSRDAIQLLRLVEDGRTPPKVIANLESPDRNPLEILKFSPDDRKLAAVTQSQAIQLWDLSLLRETLAEMKLDDDWPQYPLQPGGESTSNPE